MICAYLNTIQPASSGPTGDVFDTESDTGIHRVLIGFYSVLYRVLLDFIGLFVGFYRVLYAFTVWVITILSFNAFTQTQTCT
jgi:hypothetical protein